MQGDISMSESSDPAVRKAVIPAAGMGTRLLPATKSQPKEMLPVGRKPVIQYVMEEIAAADIRQALIVTSQQKRAIEDHFDADAAFAERLSAPPDPLASQNRLWTEMQLFYTRQSVPKGLGDAIGMAEHFVGGEPFLVSLGDSIIRSPVPGEALRRLIKTHERERAAATILFETVAPEDVVQYGIAQPKGEPGAEFAVEDLVEKPSAAEAPSTLAVAARYVFDPVIFDYIRQTPPGRGGEIQITDSMRWMLRDGRRIWGVQLGEAERRLDIGNHKSYFQAFFELSLADPELGPSFRDYVSRRLAET
jgi:UTP--glucose-1-phosphate uridylyltransferase